MWRGVGRAWDLYRARFKWARTPTDKELKSEIEERVESASAQPPAPESRVLQELSDELEAAQATIANRADAAVKFNAFALAGVAALAKTSGSAGVQVLALVVFGTSGLGLFASIQSTSPVASQAVLLLRLTSSDLESGIARLATNQRWLAGATVVSVATGAESIAAVVLA